MAFRLYIVPVVGTGTESNPRRPKYFGEGDAGAYPLTAMDYGFEPWMVIGANLDTTTDALIIGKPDCVALPLDLAATLTSAQVTTIKDKLEAANIPAGWVTTAIKWVDVVRTVLGVFAFMQRLAVAYGKPMFDNAITMGTTFKALPSDLQAALMDTAQSLGLDSSGLADTTTVRTILKAMADQFGDRRYNFNGTVI